MGHSRTLGPYNGEKMSCVCHGVESFDWAVSVDRAHVCVIQREATVTEIQACMYEKAASFHSETSCLLWQAHWRWLLNKLKIWCCSTQEPLYCLSGFQPMWPLWFIDSSHCGRDLFFTSKLPCGLSVILAQRLTAVACNVVRKEAGWGSCVLIGAAECVGAPSSSRASTTSTYLTLWSQQHRDSVTHSVSQLVPDLSFSTGEVISCDVTHISLCDLLYFQYIKGAAVIFIDCVCDRNPLIFTDISACAVL